ncbi:MAG: LysR family transcriptional regulator [Firmicutes bacterium]|nr:LysR family transcriptional regulator [Bacillota bacterium]
MNIQQLQYYISVATYQNFTKAANAHYISQTAITQQMQALETNLGIKLIDRSKRPIELTNAGKTFLQEAMAIVERYEYAVQKTKEASQGTGGTLRIGFIRGYERSSLSNYLKEFHDSHPNIFITCYREDSDTLAAGLLNGDYDLIFTWDSTNIKTEENVKSDFVENVPFYVALNTSHPFAQRKILTRKDLANQTNLYYTHAKSRFSYGDQAYMELYRQAGYEPDIVFESSNPETILMMVAANEGISILPSYVTSKLVDAENIVFIPLVGENEHEPIIRVWKSNNENELLSSFLHFIQGQK